MVPCPTCGAPDARQPDADPGYRPVIVDGDLYEAAPLPTFQARVQPWMLACFNEEIAADIVERCDRFLEEALELAQANNWPRERGYALVDYVYDRDQGEVNQEAGGVMVTLAALCLAIGVDMHEAGEAELARINQPDVIAKIRAKQAAKPTGSALPVATPRRPAASAALEELLRPFADIADQYDEREDDEFCVCTDSHESDIRDALRLGRLRRIRSVLAEHGEAVAVTDLRNVRAIFLTTDRRVRHKKRGETARVIGEAEAQVSTVTPGGEISFGVPGGAVIGRLLRDGDRLTVYQAEHDGKLWARFTDEFDDGRFEAFTDQPLDPEVERCIACDLPLLPDDLVLDDISGGTIHGSCCGPDRESYAYEDGSPLSADAPLPEPWRWGDRLQPKEA